MCGNNVRGVVGYRRPDSASGDRLRVSRVRRVLAVALVLNFGVALAKYIYGVLSGSIAMQADGFHSLFDGTSNVVGLIGLSLAARPADADHPYGHGKYETYASAVIGAMLALAAMRIGGAAIRAFAGEGASATADAGSFVVMCATLSTNIFVTVWERRSARKLRSDILAADARHTASDVWVSVGVIAGLIAVRLGMPQADPLIAIAVSLAIAYSAWTVFRQASVTLSDAARIPPESICEVVLAVEGVLGCHDIRTRGSASEVYVDLHIQVDGESSVQAGHLIAEDVERVVCEAFPVVVDVIAHLEPLDEYQTHKTTEQPGAGSL